MAWTLVEQPKANGATANASFAWGSTPDLDDVLIDETHAFAARQRSALAHQRAVRAVNPRKAALQGRAGIDRGVEFGKARQPLARPLEPPFHRGGQAYGQALQPVGLNLLRPF